MDKASITRLVLAFLGLVKLILGQMGIELQQETIDATADALSAIFIAYATWKNNYITQKGKRQKRAIERAGAE